MRARHDRRMIYFALISFTFLWAASDAETPYKANVRRIAFLAAAIAAAAFFAFIAARLVFGSGFCLSSSNALCAPFAQGPAEIAAAGLVAWPMAASFAFFALLGRAARALGAAEPRIRAEIAAAALRHRLAGRLHERACRNLASSPLAVA